jgi:hypothetical protein
MKGIKEIHRQYGLEVLCQEESCGPMHSLEENVLLDITELDLEK